MLCTSLAVLAAASLTSAMTPTGFTPGSTTQLIVDYSNKAAINGAVQALASVGTQPTIATTQRLNGTSYAVLMIDIDIPTNAPPATSTLLHWMQTGLTPATTTTQLNTSTTAMSVFLLQNSSNTAPLAPYLSPNPPARVPLSHRYTQILVDTTGMQATALDALRTAAANRTAFSAMTVLTKAGLESKVVAGNFYNVTNAGPATNAGSSNGTTVVTAGAPAQAAQSFTAFVVLFGVVLLLGW